MSSKLKLEEPISSTDKPISGGPCNQLLPSAFPHQLGLGGGSPPPWFLAAAAAGGEEDDEEEKMDMLWEDFNEELASVPPLCPLSPLINKGGLGMKDEAWLHDELILVDLEKRAKHLQHSPQDGRVVRRRRWSLALMIRLLKKLFLVKKSRNNPRTAPI
ncbi:unnamed protein product [Urochloa decumbens]|uniref:Uncharacterized protein n=1 Tax=Urochloa decumbens TaxID=240449 RepID=A0ABC9H8P8_9POAL